MSKERLSRILERCREERRPELAADLVADTAEIQIRHQFSGDDRTRALKDLRELLDNEMQRHGLGGGGR
jgi:hypothetical protein